MDRYGLLCRAVLENPAVTQRELAQELGLSLGTVNHLIKEGIERELIALPENGARYELLDQGRCLLQPYRVEGALIIAAGFGSRFVPLTFEMPKGLLEVFGERMIERQIQQLHQAGIRDITIAVGYLKEKFEYLIDKYGVRLLYNPEYAKKNTLATIYHARDILEGRNMYVLCSDHWMRENLFHAYECGAWYSSVHIEGDTFEWKLLYNKKGLITDVSVGGRDCDVMYGPVFFSREFSKTFLPVLEAYYHLPGTEQFYWENVYMELLSGEAQRRLKAEKSRLKETSLSEGVSESAQDRQNTVIAEASRIAEGHAPEMYVNLRPSGQVYEFENLEELREFDTKYLLHSDNRAMELVARVFEVPESEIREIKCLKSGMTNKSFLFQVKEKGYICRIPGPGTEFLINREQEKAVYETVASLKITEKIIYFDGKTGYKIAEYYDGARNSDARNWEDVSSCMEVLRKLHQAGLSVEHTFDFRERIEFYETLCKKHGEIPFEDYREVRRWMEELMERLEVQGRPQTLSHIDSVADNFLFLPGGEVRLIDWEYSAMCDPLVDIAMASIYSYYNEEETDRIIRIYLGREPSEEEHFTVYAYAALGGFLWSLWAVYKASLGEEFGEYTIIMYRYAKNYYRKLIRKL